MFIVPFLPTRRCSPEGSGPRHAWHAAALRWRFHLVALVGFAFSAPVLSAPARMALVAGGPWPVKDQPVAATQARLQEPFGIGFNARGGMYIVEMAMGNRLLYLDPNRFITHVAGDPMGSAAADPGPALKYRLNGAHNLAVLPQGQVLISDTWNGRVVRFDPARGQVSPIAGFRVTAELAKASGPYCVTLDSTGTTAYIADLRRVHAITIRTGESRVVAGNGSAGVPKDGDLAVNAPLVDPRAAAPDRFGNLYILERNGHALRVVDKEGRVRTVVNRAGLKGATLEPTPAVDARLNGPKHLCVDADNTVVIADAENHLIVKYLPSTGQLIRVAGTSKAGSAGLGGDPLGCELLRPHGVAVHPTTGELHIVDTYNHRILKIEATESR